MKIRSDFVTNSSSVSYILTMNRDMVDTYTKVWGSMRDEKTQRIVNLLRTDIINNGTRVMLEGKEVYTKMSTFSTEECMLDDTFDEPIENVDFSRLEEDELWAYIFGEYILNGRISKLEGFGATQVETY